MWWAGIRFWYNEQDFLSSMDCWKEAIDSMEWKDDNADTVVPKPTEEVYSGDGSYLTPLLLFLAGCYLDAGDAVEARKLCRRCLSTEIFRESLLHSDSKKSDNDFLHCLLSEYTATFQEDEQFKKPWRAAHEIADWAISERQKLLEESGTVGNSASVLLWTDPYQRPGFFYPSLSSTAVFTRQDHPEWCRTLEEHYPVIRDDFERLLHREGGNFDRGNNDSSSSRTPQHWPRVGAGYHRDGAGRHDASVVQSGGDWREIVLFGSGARPDLAPKTCRILQQYAPEAVNLAQEGAGEIIFSVLAPHTHIAPHCASTNLRLTAHLGLRVPENCYLQVKEEKLHWEEGRIIVFDDSFQHEVHNHSDQLRAVLLLRFWHPNLRECNRAEALQHVFQAKDRDRLRRCNPPLPPPLHRRNGTYSQGAIRHAQGMNQRSCATCGRGGFESIRLLDPDACLFTCICGQEAPVA